MLTACKIARNGNFTAHIISDWRRVRLASAVLHPTRQLHLLVVVVVGSTLYDVSRAKHVNI